MPVKYAVFSADANPHYSFPLPLAAAAWMRHGFTPLFLRIGEGWEAPKPALSLRALSAMGAKVVNVPIQSLWSTEQFAKTARLLAWVACSEDDYLLTTDADMVLLDKSHVDSPDWGKAFHVFYANAYYTVNRNVWPICYLGARAQFWRDLIGIGLAGYRPSTISDGTNRLLGRWADEGVAKLGRAGGRTPFSDEHILAMLVNCCPEFPHAFDLRTREENQPQFPARRVQRDCCMVDRPIDFHLPEDAWAKWNEIRPILYRILSEEQQRQLSAYHTEYMSHA